MTDSNQSAYPQTPSNIGGLTILQFTAIEAMKGLLAYGHFNKDHPELAANMAIKHAQALIKALP